MLPVKLTLRNFLAYRAPEPILFEGLHLACLSGANGAGKSSLLDAITWALWGKARGRTDQDMIALGADDMSVELDFEQEGELYRVTRQRERKRRQGKISLFVWDENVTGGFNEISGATMRDTQQRINDLLRLDYDTFVHSAFLQQGKADAFTVKTPAQRKQILADILGLEAWRDYEDRVKQELREIDTGLVNIDGRLAQIEEDLARQPALERELEEAAALEAEAQQAVEEAQARYEEIADAPAQLQGATDRLADLERRLADYLADERAIKTEAERQQARIAGYEATIAQKDAIEDGYASLVAAREADQSLGDKLMSLQDAEKRGHALEQQIAQSRAALEGQASGHHRTIEELERLSENGGALDEALDAVQGELAILREKEAERDTLREKAASLKEESASSKSTNEALHKEMLEIRQHMDTLGANTDEAMCPTCRQPLPPEKRAELLAQYQAEGKERGDTYRANDARIKEIGGEIKQAEAQVKRLISELSQLTALQKREGELLAQQKTARDATARLIEARAALSSVLKSLEAGNYAGEARAQLAALKEEIETLGYDRSAHAAARENLNTYRAYEQRQQELQIALQSLPEAQQSLQNTEARLKQLLRVRGEDQQARDEKAQEVVALKALVAEANRRYDEARERRTELNKAAEKRARAQQALHALEIARTRKKTLTERRNAMRDHKSIYEQLREAFGKNGIPAMIIEAAIPELEDATNDLLTRMTDGRMRVQFSTQREKVSGGISETLDIAIADELGTRDYALYSGGEAFRIDFAVRIALSKLLAQRAGAHLRTLFLDEGFGTQDAMGRERLVEAINAVADEFDLILVITHIDELRDAFPARLEVEKTPSGSHVRIA